MYHENIRASIENFNPLAPCGARHDGLRVHQRRYTTSIHLLRVEQDSFHRHSNAVRRVLQSTCSVWSKTESPRLKTRQQETSIHLLRVEQDRKARRWTVLLFTSIHLLRVEQDRIMETDGAPIGTSIHLLRVEQDRCYRPSVVRALYFNPLAPCGARRQYEKNRRERKKNFNPLAPCGARPTVPP